ncbi:hybrid sensor histidine kinase/response regulator [Megalodesulfovibrio paquesii]
MLQPLDLSTLAAQLPSAGSETAAILLFVLLLGLAAGAVLLHRELGRRRSTEAALRQEADRLRTLVAAVVDAPWEFDTISDDFTHSQAWRPLLGYPPRQPGKPDAPHSLLALVHPEDAASFRSALTGVLQGQALRLDLLLRCKNATGSWQWCRLRGAPSQVGPTGQVLRLTGGLLDVDTGMQTENSLREQLHLLELALQDLGLHVYWKDASLRQLWSLGPPPLPALPALYGAAGRSDPRRELLERQALATGAPMVNVVDVKDAQGGAHNIELRFMAVPDAQGRARGVLGVCQDVTARQRMTRELQEASRQAREADQAKSRFLAAMSHEIRTPMNAILGMAEVLGTTRLDREQEGFVQVLRTSGESLMAIINNILDLSRAESGRMLLEKAPFRPADLLSRLRDLFTQRCQAKGLRLECILDPGLPDRLLGDSLRLQQILSNLLENAVKFTQQGSIRVQATLLRQQDSTVEVLFEVADTGPGIPESKQDLVFHRFVQADTSTTRQFGGSGLGLALCRELTRLLGGRIWLESEPGQGSTFYLALELELPEDTGLRTSATTSTHAPPPGEPELENLPSSARTPSGTCRILLVEDSEFNAFVVASYLKGTPCRVTVAQNGEEGLRLFGEHRFDVVLMDMQMPVMDGYTATRAIRELEAVEGLPPTPVLAMTAHALEEERDRSLQAGCSAHLTKPVTRQELLDAIGRHVGLELRGVTAEFGLVPPISPHEPVCQIPPADGEYPQDGSPIPVCVDPELKSLAPTFLQSVRTKIAPYRTGPSTEPSTGPDAGLNAAQAEALVRLGHQLKGEAAAFGFPPLGILGARLEQAARSGDTAAVTTLLDRIQDVLDRIVVV